MFVTKPVRLGLVFDRQSNRAALAGGHYQEIQHMNQLGVLKLTKYSLHHPKWQGKARLQAQKGWYLSYLSLFNKPLQILVA